MDIDIEFDSHKLGICKRQSIIQISFQNIDRHLDVEKAASQAADNHYPIPVGGKWCYS